MPTVNWGGESTFDFCFDGIEKGSFVAVSTYMASANDNRSDQKEWFMAGYNELLRRIEPEKVICYNTPFPEMQGDIVAVDYERSSWKYMNHERNGGKDEFLIGEKSRVKEDLDAFKVGGQSDAAYDTMSAFLDMPAVKGGGSAYGGSWKPNPKKPEDQRFVGAPGEVKTTFKNGYRVDTKIGEDGKAEKERHYTDHKQPWAHTNPHDHMIKWDNPAGFPDPQSAINYHNDIPEFKNLERGTLMKSAIVPGNSFEQNRFTTISDFQTCMRWHGEVEFLWNGVHYSITPRNGKIAISHSALRETERLFRSSDEILNYMVGEDRLRDVITKVTVLDRTI